MYVFERTQIRPREEFRYLRKPQGGYLGRPFPPCFSPLPPCCCGRKLNTLRRRARRGLDKYSNLNRGLGKGTLLKGGERARGAERLLTCQEQESRARKDIVPRRVDRVLSGGRIRCRRAPGDKSRRDGQFGVEWPGSDGELVPQGRWDDTPRGHMRTRPPRGAGLGGRSPQHPQPGLEPRFSRIHRSLSLVCPFFPVVEGVSSWGCGGVEASADWASGNGGGVALGLIREDKRKMSADSFGLVYAQAAQFLLLCSCSSLYHRSRSLFSVRIKRC